MGICSWNLSPFADEKMSNSRGFNSAVTGTHKLVLRSHGPQGGLGTRRKVIFRLSVLAAAFLTLSFAPNQTNPTLPQTTPRFKIGVDLVPVDVTVLDRKGNPVLDLGRSDFTVFEDGVEQDIVHFSLETFPTGQHETVASETGRSAPVDALQHPGFRRFLIVLGRGGHETFRPIEKLSDFVRGSLGPADEVAVIAYNRATDFTTDHGKIADFLDRFQELNPYVERIMSLHYSGLASFFGTRRFPPSLQPRIDRLFEEVSEGTHEVATGEGVDDSADRGAAENLMTALREAMPVKIADAQREFEGPGGTDRWDGSGPNPYGLPRQNNGGPSPENRSFEEYVRHRLETDQDLLNIFAGIEYLRYLEGEKHLVYFSSSGLFLPKADNRETIGRIAADARVRIDTFKTEGLFLKLSGQRQNRFAQGSFRRDYAIRSLQQVSRETGGTACIHRSIKDALKLVGRATSRVYLLGYVPKNSNPDGSFRKIEVKVDRKDVRVLARGGYFARPRLQPYDRERMIIYARVTAAAEHPGDIDDFPFSVSIANLRREKESVHFELALKTADTPALQGDERGKSPQKLVAGLFFLARNGELLDTRWKDITLQRSTARIEEAASTGLTVRWGVEMPRKTGHGYLKVVVYDPSSDRVGSRVVKLR